MLDEINIKSLRETYKEFIKSFGYDCDNNLNIAINSELVNIKELKTALMFQQIILYLENQKEEENVK